MFRISISDCVKVLVVASALLVHFLHGAGPTHAQSLRTTVLAGGCFWCIESDFESVRGVVDVTSGFSGGRVANPSYREVVRGGTGHLEVVQITYDPSIVSYEQILHLFLRSIDPLDAGGQFCDRGESYASAIFVETSAERAAAEAAIAEAQAALGAPIVTPIRDRAPFYPAEAYHQDYYRSDEVILTRFGPRRKAVAYELYRSSCGRDQRVLDLWGNAAPFARDHL